MAAGVKIQHKRKAGAFAGGELAVGELGVNTSAPRLEFSKDGSTITVVSVGGGDALTSNPLSQFASTTSAQLLGVISDETGTGALVFGTSPTISGASLGSSSTATTQSSNDNSTKLATTAYVDSAFSSFDSKPQVAYASTSALPANTYSNGSSGVGATLTGTSNGPLIIDGVTILIGQVNERVLVAGEATAANNGWWTITQIGVVAVSPYILTRAVESNQAVEISSGYITSVIAPNGLTPGSANNGKVFISIAAANPFVVGTTNLTFTPVGNVYSAGTGIGLSGTTFSIDTGVTVDKTTTQILTNKDLSSGTNTFPTLNQSTTGSAATLTTPRTIGGVSFNGSSNITVSTATGGFTVSGGNLALGTNSITMSGSLGVTGTRITKGWFTDLESTNVPTVSGSPVYFSGGTDVAVADGGTGKSAWTQYLLTYADTTASLAQIPIGSSGQVLTSNGAGSAPSFQTVSGGGSTTSYSEVPSGTVNGSNTTFTLSHTPASSSGVIVLLDGINQYNGVDYTVSGNTITFTAAPATGSSPFAYYNILSSGAGSTSIIDVGAVYGVIADGTTDNTTALMQMQSDLSGLGKPHYILIFPTGTITYTNNRFLYNIQSLEIIGGASGTTFRNTYSGSDEIFQRPFYVGDMWDTNVLTYSGSHTSQASYKVNSASIGDRTLTCTTTADAANFSAGNRIFLWAFDQVGDGYPPGTRYNEWHTIESVNTGTGVITLSESLKNNYDSTWWDVPNIPASGMYSGTPKILLLDRSGYSYPKYFKARNITWGAPLTGASHASGSFSFAANTIKLENCNFEGNFWPSQCADFTATNCKIIADPAHFTSEIDKNGGIGRFYNCYFRSQVGNATGWETIIIDDGCVFDQSILLCPRNLSIKNSTINGDIYPSSGGPALGAAPAGLPIRNFEIQNLILNRTASNTGPLVEVNTRQEYTLTDISGNNIVIPWTTAWDDSATAQQAYRMEAGYTRLTNNDGSKGGLVTSVTWNGSYGSNGGFVVAGNWGLDISKTGTITASTASATVTGSSTLFTTELQIGQAVKSGSNILGIVAAIASNTSLTLKANSTANKTAQSYSQSNAPVIGEVWGFREISNFKDLGGHSNLKNVAPTHGQYSTFNRGTGKTIKTVTLDRNSFDPAGSDQVIKFFGKIIDAEVNVIKPYTGTNSGSIITISDENYSSILVINLGIIGRRFVNEFSATGTKTSETLDTTKFDKWIQTIHSVWRDGTFTSHTDYAQASLPVFEIIVRYME